MTKKAAPKVKSPTVKVMLSTFDDRDDKPLYRVIRDGVKLKDFAAVTPDDYAPWGATPLLDAVVEFIEGSLSRAKKTTVTIGLLLDESGSMSGNRLAVIDSVNEFVDGLKEVGKVDPKTAGKGFLVIATDGNENASRKHKYEDVTAMVKKAEKEGWVTIFLGANMDAWEQGNKLGLSGSATGQSVNFTSTDRGTRSALRGTTQSAVGYLGDHDQYMAQASAAPKRTITEDGDENEDPFAQPTPPASRGVK